MLLPGPNLHGESPGWPRLAKQRRQAFLPSTCPGTSGFWLTPESGLDPWGLEFGGQPVSGSRCQAGRPELDKVHQAHFPHFPPAQEVDPCKACWENPSLSGTFPCPSRPCSGVWPWPRTQGPAPAFCRRRRRRRKVGWFWTKQEIGWAHCGAGVWAPDAVCSASLQTV